MQVNVIVKTQESWEDLLSLGPGKTGAGEEEEEEEEDSYVYLKTCIYL